MEFLQECIALVNLPYTVMLAFIVGYWLLVIVGAMDFDIFTPDVDAGLDTLEGSLEAASADADVHVPAHTGADLPTGDVDAGDVDATQAAEVAGPGLLVSLLKFFNIGEIPLMMILSIFVLTAWVVSILTNAMFSNREAMWAVVLMPVNVIFSLLVTKIVSTPLVSIYRKLDVNSGKSYEDLVGKSCIVKSSTVSPTHGQVVLQTPDGAPRVLNAICKPGEQLNRGDRALIIEHDRRRNVYDIIKFNDLES